MRAGLILLVILVALVGESQRTDERHAERGEYKIGPSHPRLIIEDVATVAKRCAGPFGGGLSCRQERADAAKGRGGIEFINNQWSIPEDLMNCGPAFLWSDNLGARAGLTRM